MAMANLIREKCRPCNAEEPVILEEEMKELLPQVPDWRVEERDGIKRLVREFKFNSYSEAMTFTNRTAQLAEEMGHHPAMLTEWGKVTVSWWTHKIKGLHRNDFVMAARTDVVYDRVSSLAEIS